MNHAEDADDRGKDPVVHTIRKVRDGSPTHVASHERPRLRILRNADHGRVELIKKTRGHIR